MVHPQPPCPYTSVRFDSMNCGRFGAKMKGVRTLIPTVQGREAATLWNSTLSGSNADATLIFTSFRNNWGGLLLLALPHHKQPAEQRRWNSDLKATFLQLQLEFYGLLCCPVTCLNVYYADKCVCGNMLLTFTVLTQR